MPDDPGGFSGSGPYFGDASPWYHGNPPCPWIMSDQANNLVGCVNADGSKLCANLPNITWRFVTGIAKGDKLAAGGFYLLGLSNFCDPASLSVGADVDAEGVADGDED